MHTGRTFGLQMRRIAALLLFSLAMQEAPPSGAQEPAQADLDASESFRLPASHRSSIYFFPGSAGLTETALACLSVTAERLQADTALYVTVVGYADDLGEASQAEELRAGRAAAVADALVALGVPPRRIAAVTTDGEEEAVLPCISEYCRQNYRRAALLFSKFTAR